MKREQEPATIWQLDLEPIKFALSLKSDGMRWSVDRADSAVESYRRFIYLIWKYPDQVLVPTEEIDAAWHAHILDTRKYMADCEKIFGGYLHHFPYFGECGDDDRKNLNASFAQTVALFEREFGSVPNGLTTEGSLCGGKGCGGSCKGHLDESPEWSDARRVVSETFMATRNSSFPSRAAPQVS